MKYHYGMTIREYREKLNMTQAELAEKWPRTDGGIGVSLNYVSDVERGKKIITNIQTLRRLCDLLNIPLWKVGLSDYDPFNPKSSKGQISGLNDYGIIKLTNSAIDRIFDYKNCLLEAKGNCFISGTSMIHLTEDSSEILREKLQTGNIYMLILDPDWIQQNSSILTFIDEDARQDFHFEIRNSIRKINQLRKSLPQELISRLKIKTYTTIFPYIMTGYDNGETGKIVFEITDYIPEKNRPRFTLKKINDQNSFFDQVKSKFFSIWNNHSISKEIL